MQSGIRIYGESDGTHTGFAMVDRGVARCGTELTDGEFRARVVLASFDWHGEGCWPSLETIAGAMGCSTDKAGRCLDGLVAKGHVEKRRRGRGLTNTYLLLDRSDSAHVRVLDSALVRSEVEAVEVDEEPQSNTTAVESAVADPDLRGSEQDRLELFEALRQRVLPHVIGADENTETTWATMCIRAGRCGDPGLAEHLEAKILGVAPFTPIEPTVELVTTILRDHLDGYQPVAARFDQHGYVDDGRNLWEGRP